MIIDTESADHCGMLLDRIERTLEAIGFDMNGIRKQPRQFCENDACIFEGLCKAILSIQAVFTSIEKNSGHIKKNLFDYDIDKVAGLSDVDVERIFESKFKPLRIQSGRLKQGLLDIRDDARIFRSIKQRHGSVRDFIAKHLKENQEEVLRDQFIGRRDGFKLRGVGPAICSEFFNGIGIDEFKADVHTSRFFNRIKLAQTTQVEEIRRMGKRIASRTRRPRIYVDSLIWNLCAEGRGEICTKNNPKSHWCKLYTEEPRLCDCIHTRL